MTKTDKNDMLKVLEQYERYYDNPELFNIIRERLGSYKNPIYTLEVLKPKGKENVHWKDIPVDWKVW